MFGFFFEWVSLFLKAYFNHVKYIFTDYISSAISKYISSVLLLQLLYKIDSALYSNFIIVQYKTRNFLWQNMCTLLGITAPTALPIWKIYWEEKEPTYQKWQSLAFQENNYFWKRTFLEFFENHFSKVPGNPSRPY